MCNRTKSNLDVKLWLAHVERIAQYQRKRREQRKAPVPPMIEPVGSSSSALLGGKMIDVAKLSAESRWRLMRFSEAFEKHDAKRRIVHQQISPDSLEVGVTEVPDDQAFGEYLGCRMTLKNCDEAEILDLVDRSDPASVLDRNDIFTTTVEQREQAHAEMKRVEATLVALGKQCAQYIKNLK
jgi:hypothetical protein